MSTDPEIELYSVQNDHHGDDRRKVLSWRDSEDEDFFAKPTLFDRIYNETDTGRGTYLIPEAEENFGDDESKHEDEDDDDIQSSIDAIREEASRIDTILAIDKLDTLKQELDEIKRQLRHKNLELAEKRSIIKVKDDRLATLELERDLFKADAHKLKTDLRKASHGFEGRSAESPQPDVMRGEATSPGKVEPHETSSNEDPSTEDGSITSRRPLYTQNLCAAEANFLGPTKRLASIIVSRKKKERSLSQVPLMSAMYPIPGLTRTPPTTREAPVRTGLEIPSISLEAQVLELHQRLKSSMETAEELRRRLAMVSCYYETTIHRLQARLLSTKADQAKMEEELLQQIAVASEAKKRAVAALEAKLREKDDEIDRLRAVQ